MRPPKFHVFPPFAKAWPDVLPGDAIVSPDTRLYHYNEFLDRGKHGTHAVIVKRNPLLVVARLDYVPGASYQEPVEQLSTYVVYSITRGFLVGLMYRQEQHG